MKKSTLLAAASVVAIFAGVAHAGEISGSVGGENFTGTAAYTLPTEIVLPTGGISTTATGFEVVNSLDDAITVVDGTTQNYVVTFTLTGGAWSSDPATPAVDATGGGTGGVTFAAAGKTATTVTYVATATATGADLVISGFSVEGGLDVTTETSVTAASSVSLVAGGVQFPLESSAAVTAIDFKTLVGNFTADSVDNAVAQLPDFLTFDSGVSATLATDLQLSAASTDDYYGDLEGNAVTLADIIDDLTVTITGPELGSLEATLGGASPDDIDGNDIVFEGADAGLIAGTSDFTVTQTGTQAINAGSFTAALAIAYETGFSGATSKSAIPAGSISLDGINFVAPWVSGTGLATSVIRIGNSGSVPSGNVSVRLLNAVTVSGGVSTPVTSTAVYNAGPVAAGGDLQITSAQLVGAFGAFTRGDFQITIQSNSTALSAKLRNTRDGVSFEQSLGSFSADVVQ